MFFRVIKYYASRYLHYPFEFIALVVQRIVVLALLVWFWSILMKNQTYDQKVYQFTYFLLTSAVADLVAMTGVSRVGMGRFLRKAIKSGKFSAFVMMPMSVLKYSYAMSLGKNAIHVILAVIQLILGISMLPNITFTNFLWFVLLTVNAFAIAFSINLFEATLAFFFTEADGIKNVLVHFIRIFSGRVLPLHILVPFWRFVVFISPFSMVIYWPVVALSMQTAPLPYHLIFLLGLTWAIMFNIILYKFWQHGLKQYEAVGL